MVNDFALLSRWCTRSASSLVANMRKVALVTLLGMGSVVAGSQGAIAAEMVTLELDSGELTITIDELRTFAETGELSPETQEFFNTNQQDAPVLQSLISEEIFIGSDVEEFFDTSTGEFVIIQLDKLISRSPSEETLSAIRTALRTSYEDDGRFSILEIAEVYPESDIYLDLRGLETVYADVKTFVERIRPALETAKEFLQELICDCETVTTSDPSVTESPASTEPEAAPDVEPTAPDAEMDTEVDDDTSSAAPALEAVSHSSLQNRDCAPASMTEVSRPGTTSAVVQTNEL